MLAPEGHLRHRIEEKAPTIIEKAPLRVGKLVEIFGPVIYHARPEYDIMAAGYDIEWIQLDGLTVVQGLLGP
jgi:hypothetical protein